MKINAKKTKLKKKMEPTLTPEVAAPVAVAEPPSVPTIHWRSAMSYPPYGRTFCFSMLYKDDKGELHPSYQIYSCRDYLLWQLFIEKTKLSPTELINITTSRAKGCLKDGHIHLLVMETGTNTDERKEESIAAANWLEENLQVIVGVVNELESIIGIDERTTAFHAKLAETNEKCVVFKLPAYWSRATYLLSLVSLTIRVAIRNKAKANEPWTKVMARQSVVLSSYDAVYANAALSKVKTIAAWPKGKIDEMDFEKKNVQVNPSRALGFGSYGIYECWLKTQLT
jgi:hypothetical protein